MADVALKPEPVKELPKGAGRRRANPALPIVQNSHNKGPQRLNVGKANVAKVRSQLNRAGSDLGVKVRTRVVESEPDFVYFQVTDKD